MAFFLENITNCEINIRIPVNSVISGDKSRKKEHCEKGYFVSY